MKFIKIDLQNRRNTTLLAKAYMEKLFPKSISGDIYYFLDLFDMDTPVRYIYFTEIYYEKLFYYLSEDDFLSKISKSNAEFEWKNLAERIKIGSVINEDIGILKIYDYGEQNFDPILLDNEEIQNILKIQPKDNLDNEELQEEVLKDLKRIYKRLNISVSGLMKGIGLALSIPIKFENEQKFSFYPIFEVLKKFDLNIKDMDIYKGEEKNFLNIQIVIKEWSK